MEFRGHDGKMVLLRGMHSYPPQTMSVHRMEANLRHGDIEWAVEFRISDAGGKPQPPHPDVQAILYRYPAAFGDIPQGQPTDKGFEHTIELKPGVQAMITTPYQHPKAYQDEIERTINELLVLGHIRPRYSLFASSVILVKKKDGTLRMCIDYRALNKKTLKNWYPIPQTDELMNELRGSKYLDKIDLFSRYPQDNISLPLWAF